MGCAYWRWRESCLLTLSLLIVLIKSSNINQGLFVKEMKLRLTQVVRVRLEIHRGGGTRIESRWGGGKREVCFLKENHVDVVCLKEALKFHLFVYGGIRVKLKYIKGGVRVW